MIENINIMNLVKEFSIPYFFLKVIILYKL